MNLADVRAPVAKAKICSRTQKELGQAGINMLLRHLWPVDCQTCGETLGGGKPSIVVTEWPTWHEASVHHQDCRTAMWNDSRLIIDMADLTTYSYYDLATVEPDGTDGKPVILINPTMERVRFIRDPDGDAWRVLQLSEFGFKPLRQMGWGRQYVTREVLLVLSGDRCQGHVDGVIALGGEPQWEVKISDTILGHVRSAGGILVIVTHVLNPALFRDMYDLDVLRGLLDSGDCSASFAAIAKITLRPEKDTE